MKTGAPSSRLFPFIERRLYGRSIFLPLMPAFIAWLQKQSYAAATIDAMVCRSSRLDRYLQRRFRISSVRALTSEMLAAAYTCFQPSKTRTAVVHAWNRFLRETNAIPAPKPLPLSPAHAEAERFAQHLRDVRGLVEKRVSTCRQRTIRLLEFLGFDRDPSVLTRARPSDVQDFVRGLAATHNRASLMQVISSVREFLRYEFSHDRLRQPLHQQIERPRLFRGEGLPQPLAWSQVGTLLRSIDTSVAQGSRDFTILYLAVVYGLRCGELTRLRLEDIDWRNGNLRIEQTKTRQTLVLPLTDEAGEVLMRYIRDHRSRTSRRELFLHARAPLIPLSPSALTLILQMRARSIRPPLPHCSMHTLRHSLAVRLVRRGVTVKVIADVLGHRLLSTTAGYLRLSLDDLRAAGLPVPPEVRPAPLLGERWKTLPFPRVMPSRRLPRSARWRSGFADSLREYLATRRALGHRGETEEVSLRAWDSFMCARQGKRTHVDRATVEAWARKLGHVKLSVQRLLLRHVRLFLIYFRRSQPRTFVPELTSFPRPPARTPRRIVSPHEMARLLATARQLKATKFSPLRPHTIRIALILLFCCGLRRGELLRLQLRHYDPAERVLRIDQSKFYKSRLVPLPASVAAEMKAFLVSRKKQHFGHTPESFLLWRRAGKKNAHYTRDGLTSMWKHLCYSAGVVDERGRAPRVHDLRHSFAVNALHRWYRQGVAPQARLMHLATYLGHVGASSSHYYLQFTPALQAAASARFEHACGAVAAGGAA